MGSGASAEGLEDWLRVTSQENLNACFNALDAGSRQKLVKIMTQLESSEPGSSVAGETIQVRVESLIGNEIGTFELAPTASVDSVKDMLCLATNTPVEHKHLLKLVLFGTILETSKTLHEHGVDGLAPLTLVKESGARLGVLPDFCGFYIGENSEGGGVYVWEMVMDSVEFIEISKCDGSAYSLDDAQTGSYLEGVLHWRLVKGPETQEDITILRCREFVKGIVKEDGSFEFDGYKIEPRRGIIACGQYALRMSEMGDMICGTFKGPLGTCDGEFQLQRKGGTTAEEWRMQRKEDILNCKHPAAGEVRSGNQST